MESEGLVLAQPELDHNRASDRDSSCKAKDSVRVSVTISLTDTRETSLPWRQPSITTLLTEECIAENLTRHREAILLYLVPAQLFKLLFEFELDEISTSTHMTRRKQAEILLDRILEKSVYMMFLEELEGDTEHMGHRYIASLLRGEEFARDEETQQSEMLLHRIQKEWNAVVQLLNVTELEPLLHTHKLLTSETLESLRNPQSTSEEKARIILTILKTKGPTAHFTFVHKCLAAEDHHLGHRELYQLLTAPRETRKRRASTSTTMVSKRYPCLLDPPEGITTETYMEKIAAIRQHHLKGGEMWGVAESTIQEDINAPENPLEMKIALLLESCNYFVLNRQPDEVLARVDRAREMCLSLYSKESNAQVLEGRCEWVLARLYRFEGDFESAKTHIDTAFSLTANCAMGEEKILINFVSGSIILDTKTKSPLDLKQAITSFKKAITLASEEDYGMKMAQYCKIYLALAYVGSSPTNPRKSREGLSQDSIEEAKKVLKDMEHEEIHDRTRWAYFMACCNVHRLAGQRDQANAYASQALKFAHKHQLSNKIKSKILANQQKYLKDTQAEYLTS